MKLTETEHRLMAQKAYWYFDCYFGIGQGESSVFTGDGVDDLDTLIIRITSAYATRSVGRKAWFLADVGTQYSDWRPFDVEDLVAIRAFYIFFYGNVNKPPVLERNQLPGGPQAIPLRIYGAVE